MAFKIPFLRKKDRREVLPSTQKEREEREAARISRAERHRDPNSRFNMAMPYVWITLAVFLGLSVYTSGGGFVGGLLRFLSLSLFSYLTYAFPILLFLTGITWRRNVEKHSVGRTSLLFTVALLLVLALIYILTLPKGAIGGAIPKEEVLLNAEEYFDYADPRPYRGGFFGALVGWVMYRLVGPVLTIILTAFAVLLYGIFAFGFSPDSILRSALGHLRVRTAERKQKREEARREQADRVRAEREARSVPTTEPTDEPTVPDTEPTTEGPVPSMAKEEPTARPEEVKHRSFADIFRETGGGTEPARTTDAPVTEAATDEASLRAFKERKIRERLRSHDGIHTYAVADLCPSTITEPEETVTPPLGTAEGGITHMSAAVLTRAAEIAEEEATPFRGVEDFRRITVTEPVRVHPPVFTPPAEAAPATVEAPSISPTVTADEEERDDPTAVREGGVPVDRAAPAVAPIAVPTPAPRAEAKPQKREAVTDQFPSLNLLRIPAITEAADEEEISRNAETLVKTLESFGIPITITGYTRGPRITRYEFVQKAGIRVAKVASYADDITQKLSTQGVRIEAPIPNKSSIGVEVPNRKSPPVRIRSLLDTDKFRDAESKTTVAVGCDVTGTPVFFDIAKAPHMLIAGATGMGKSVCINSILISLLYKASPEEVRLILIDPKKVEFNVYSKVPHLLIPVVTDPTKAAGALNWAVNEMERRYDMIESASVRDIKGYNAYCRENGMPTLPKIVIVIDELNDLMMSARKMVEASICRIAQKARAAGIHLLIGTQRPSVNVITGDIKVNIPARIAFRVNQAVDSRTILDMQGAEKLLPHGDMLFSPAGTPQRVQGAFVEDEEVKAVTSFLAQNVGEAIFDDAILADIEKEAAKCAQKNGDDDGDDEGGGGSLDGVLDDPKFEQALDVAFSTGSISTSLLQRRIGVGFGRASRFIDAMCEMGIVGESRGGAKPREILLSRAEYEERKRRVFDE